MPFHCLLLITTAVARLLENSLSDRSKLTTVRTSDVCNFNGQRSTPTRYKVIIIKQCWSLTQEINLTKTTSVGLIHARRNVYLMDWTDDRISIIVKIGTCVHEIEIRVWRYNRYALDRSPAGGRRTATIPSRIAYTSLKQILSWPLIASAPENIVTWKSTPCPTQQARLHRNKATCRRLACLMIGAGIRPSRYSTELDRRATAITDRVTMRKSNKKIALVCKFIVAQVDNVSETQFFPWYCVVLKSYFADVPDFSFRNHANSCPHNQFLFLAFNLL